jgi:hypothetical protein
VTSTALARRGQGISDDAHAVDILNRVCVLVVNGNSGKAVGDGRATLRFTHDVNGIFAGADFSLFLCMLLVNREGLVLCPFLPSPIIFLNNHHNHRHQNVYIYI